MKKFLSIFAIALACVALGVGSGLLIGNGMEKTTESGYVGPQNIEIADGVMTPEVLLALGRLGDPQLSPDGKSILYGVSYNSIADNRSCRNLYVCDVDGSNPRRISRYARSVSNARWSKDGSSIYFVQGGQIWQAPLVKGRLGKKVQLSDIPSGVGEFKLSPDQSRLIYTSTIKNPALKQAADVDPAFDKAQAYVAEDLMYRHWDHWVTEIPRSYVASLDGGMITADNSVDILGSELFELPSEPFGGVEQLDWSPDGRYIAYSCRKLCGKQYAFSTNTDIYVYDVVSAKTVAVTSGGGYDTDPVFVNGGRNLAWISMARDGYESDAQRIMVCDFLPVVLSSGKDSNINIKNIRQLASSLDRDASGLFWHDDRLYFAALTDGVQALYSVTLDDELSRLTPPEWWYDFFAPFAAVPTESGLRLLASYYSMNAPLELVAVDVDAAGSVSYTQLSNENGHILHQLAPISHESVLVPTVDDQRMQCWILYPPQFDPDKVYPAIEIVLGGPQGTNSQDWSYRWCYRLMAQQGYIVILPNRRGTSAFGQEWKEQISGDYCGLNMQDYMSAGRYIKSKPYVGKLACVGASYGGFSAYMLEGLHGDIYDCFIAHAGIFDEEHLWYTTEEMWFANWDNGGLTEYAYSDGQTGPAGDGVTFGGMQQAGAPYASTPLAQCHYANDPKSMITEWHTPILCIHGMMDFRIPYGQGMAAFNAAQMMGVPSKLVLFPEETHWVLQPQNALLWHREVYDWLDRWVK